MPGLLSCNCRAMWVTLPPWPSICPQLGSNCRALPTPALCSPRMPRHVDALFSLMHAPESFLDGKPADTLALQVGSAFGRACVRAHVCVGIVFLHNLEVGECQCTCLVWTVGQVKSSAWKPPQGKGRLSRGERGICLSVTAHHRRKQAWLVEWRTSGKGRAKKKALLPCEQVDRQCSELSK